MNYLNMFESINKFNKILSNFRIFGSHTLSILHFGSEKPSKSGKTPQRCRYQGLLLDRAGKLGRGESERFFNIYFVISQFPFFAENEKLNIVHRFHF